MHVNHLDDIRIMELALDQSSSIAEEERAHLKSCALCAKRIKEEEEFTALLGQIPPQDVPQGFAARATARFAEAARAKAPVALHRPLLAGVWLAIAFAACSLWLIIGNFTLFATFSAAAIARIAAMARAVAVVLNNLPVLASLMMVGLSALVLVSAGLVTALARRSSFANLK
jgi:hypothetical protein